MVKINVSLSQTNEDLSKIDIKKLPKDNQSVILRLKELSKDVYSRILKRIFPELSIPIRSLSNVEYDQKEGYFKNLGKTKIKKLNANSVKSFSQMLLLMNQAKEIALKNETVSKREAYYNAKSWGDARFKEENEAFDLLDDMEAMVGFNREKLGYIPQNRGGSVAGKLIIEDSGDVIDCTKFGSGAYSIPPRVEELVFKTKAKFILMLETEALFSRLHKHKFWESHNCIIIAMGGVPTRATRRFARRLSDSCKLDVHVFTDGDFYGYMNIYRTLKVGSGNSAHINEFFCVPSAKFLGVTPQDIIDYNLPTHPLEPQDIKRGKDAIKNDPFVHNYKEWEKAINHLIKLGVRPEQQAFAAQGLNYVLDTYLPNKLKNRKTWLP